tara:strand:- start:9066 stop:10118 length:1053 start_codon:yes stop_codon:yes gene_type:complete
MKLKVSTLFFIFFFTITSVIAQVQQTRTMYYGNETREYSIYVPATYNSSIATPILLSFHGGGGDGLSMMLGTNDMRPIADTANFIAVYPSGSGGAWMHKAPTNYNDIYFVEAIIDTLSSQFNIDNNRVYACGYSEGGIFSYELACRLSNRIAAIAAVSGSMLSDSYRTNEYGFPACAPNHPTAIMLIPGTNDMNPHSMYNGFPPYYISVNDITDYWSAYNNTDITASVIQIANTNPNDGSDVEKKIWENGDKCVSVVELKVNGGDHDWPGTSGNMDINASEEIWKFLSKHNINGLINCPTNNYENVALEKKAKIISIVDLFGRETRSNCNSIMFFIKEDGTAEKKVILNK